MTKEILLKTGYIVLVDNEFFDEMNRYNWYVQKNSTTIYVKRRLAKEGRVSTCFMHRQLLNAPTGVVVDHINGNGLDNRMSNLRLCNQNENTYNSRKRNSNTSSLYKGVCWEKFTSRWKAEITVDRRHITLGRFNTQEDAALAYNDAAVKYFGNFSSLNVV